MREDESLPPAEKDAQIERMRSEWQVPPRSGRSGPAACTSSAPSGTSRGASTISCAVAPGRQGDPGSSRFYLSLEDPLMRIFGGERLGAIMQSSRCRRASRSSTRSSTARSRRRRTRVESRNFDIRKQLLEYDDVANDQRRVIYQQRNELLESGDIADTVRNMIVGLIDETGRRYIPPESVEEQWDIPGLEAALACRVPDAFAGR